MAITKAVKTFSNNSAFEERRFLLEVTGIAQENNDSLDYPIRNSGNTFIAVDYSHFNYELNRINRLGGRVVNISSLGFVAPVPSAGVAQTEKA